MAGQGIKRGNRTYLVRASLGLDPKISESVTTKQFMVQIRRLKPTRIKYYFRLAQTHLPIHLMHFSKIIYPIGLKMLPNKG